jgi:hypothetical protein
MEPRFDAGLFSSDSQCRGGMRVLPLRLTRCILAQAGHRSETYTLSSGTSSANKPARSGLWWRSDRARRPCLRVAYAGGQKIDSSQNVNPAGCEGARRGSNLAWQGDALGLPSQRFKLWGGSAFRRPKKI